MAEPTVFLASPMVGPMVEPTAVLMVALRVRRTAELTVVRTAELIPTRDEPALVTVAAAGLGHA